MCTYYLIMCGLGIGTVLFGPVESISETWSWQQHNCAFSQIDSTANTLISSKWMHLWIIKYIVEANQISVSKHCISCDFDYNSCIK